MPVLMSLARQFVYKPFFTLLNLLGLAAGIATCVLILLYTSHELSFDDWVADQDTLYRVEGQFIQSGTYLTNTMTPLQPAIEAGIPEIAASARYYRPTWPVKKGNFVEYETVSLVDRDFLDMFPLAPVAGARPAAFTTPSDIFISERIAQKYFGADAPIGETLTINQTSSYTVAGIFRDLPANSDFTLDFVIEFQENLIPRAESWNNVGLQTYVRLEEEANKADVLEKLALIVDANRPFIGIAPGDMRELFWLFLQPFSDIHLGSYGRTSSNEVGKYSMIYGLIAIAFLILIVSAFNYVGLATARALEREKEICLRKVLGANRRRIVHHILAESIAMTILAALIGIGIAEMTLPYFSSILDADFSSADLFTAVNMAWFIIGSLILGTIAGLYPAFFVTGFRPVRFLNGSRAGRAGLAKIRAGLVFVQFLVAISLIAGAVTISQQIQLIQSRDLGFEQSDILVLRGVNRPETVSKAETLKERLKAAPGVESAARSSVAPLDNSSHYEGFFSRHVTREESATLRIFATDYDFLDTYRAKLSVGRFLEERFAKDEIEWDQLMAGSENTGSNIVINQAAVALLGYSDPQTILGETIQLELDSGGAQPLTVVGVVGDIYFRSLRNDMEGQIFTYDPDNLDNLSIRLRDGTPEAAIREIWSDLYPDTPYRADFLEDRISASYSDEQSQLQLFIVFSAITIILSIVGLVGMVLNSVAHREKEISLRRVVGASVGNIVRLFTWQYLRPVLIAILPASLIAYYFLDQWLQKYPERVDIGVGLFVLSGGSVMIITAILVAMLVSRRALTSPALGLRYE